MKARIGGITAALLRLAAGAPAREPPRPVTRRGWRPPVPAGSGRLERSRRIVQMATGRLPLCARGL